MVVSVNGAGVTGVGGNRVVVSVIGAKVLLALG